MRVSRYDSVENGRYAYVPTVLVRIDHGAIAKREVSGHFFGASNSRLIAVLVSSITSTTAPSE